MRRLSGMTAAAVGVLAATLAGCGPRSETCEVSLSYVLQPTKELPAGLKSIAILDSAAEVTGAGDDDERARKWSTIAADMMEQMLQDSNAKFQSGLTVAKRRDTAKVLAEQDLKAAGLVDAATASKAAKLLDVQALITSKLNVRIDVKKEKKTTFDVTNVFGGGGRGYGGGGASITPREAEQISRDMTIQCSFALVDASTGEAFVQYSPKPFRKFDRKKPGAVFGRSKGEGDLDPADEYIGELVEKGVREFVSSFVPCEVSYTYELKSGRSDAARAGIRALRADDYDVALSHFKAAVNEKPDDHRSLFAMGVVSELKGDFDAALKYYKQVVSMSDLDEDDMAVYLAAKQRVTEHKDRIRKVG